jgi:hypothetical protein
VQWRRLAQGTPVAHQQRRSAHIAAVTARVEAHTSQQMGWQLHESAA